MPQQAPIAETATLLQHHDQQDKLNTFDNPSRVVFREDGDKPEGMSQSTSTSSPPTMDGNGTSNPVANAAAAAVDVDAGGNSQDQQTISATQLEQQQRQRSALTKASTTQQVLNQQSTTKSPSIDECNDVVNSNSENKTNSSNAATDSKPPPPTSQRATTTTTTATTTTTTTTATATKLNGLKNRIIQRPPPLVLDKVSNFYDNDSNSCIAQPPRHHQQQQHQYQNTKNTISSDNNIATSNNNTISNKQEHHHLLFHQPTAKVHQITNPVLHDITGSSQTDDPTTAIDRISSTTNNNRNNSNSNNINNANQKFWASLNENASRNKALANARSTSATAVLTNKDNHAHSKTATVENDSVDSLGPDLIIKHRYSSGTISSHRVVSTLSARKQLDHHNNNNHHQPHHLESHRQYPNQKSTSKTHAIDADQQKQQQQQQQDPNQNLEPEQHQHKPLGCNDDNLKEQLNNSEDIEDCEVASDTNGGNLIGVENITPPALDLQQHNHHHHNDHHRLEEPPASATSSRPRSNNPFLDENDDDFEEYRNSIRSESANRADSLASHQNNFHKRPASFIAATDRVSGFNKSSYFGTNQQIIEEKFNELSLNDQFTKNSATHPAEVNESLINNATKMISTLNNDYLDSQAFCQSSPLNSPNQYPVPTHYDTTQNQSSIYGSNNPYINRFQEPTISVDSESTICQPPPSATMQLPHWTDAIYELNNAILETSSVSGGAENGQFIHIAENGDIILELDHIKVSGFTLVEFNELVESKQFHLLSAVQTKHSHGLTVDLRQYLNISFPKNTKDKQLQNVIRENIYRRTIPCTTRPPKPGEVDKVDYHFLTKEQFIEMNKRGMLLECGVYVGHYYGTLKPLCDLNQLHNYSEETPTKDGPPERMRHAWDANHPAVEMIIRRDASHPHAKEVNEQPLYENHESLRQRRHHGDHMYTPSVLASNGAHQVPIMPEAQVESRSSSIIALNSEALPPGWERVMDQTHGTYYIDHNTQRTQYERPYEVELTKGSMGFGFTLVEADSGLLLVRSIIPGGPAHMNGSIRPGDILVSAVGVSVTGLQHTDIARLFSTFAVGDRVRLVFARSNYVLDDNLVPDEYLFSNGTNGDLAIAVNPNNYQPNQSIELAQNPHILVNQEFEYIKVVLKRGNQGFGFTISDSIAGQKVRKIQNHEICSNLKQGDILINLNGEDIAKLTHKEVVERLKKCPPGEDVTLTIKRKKRFRSKTPMAMHTDASGEYSLDSTPQRNCKTPSLDGLMLRRPSSNYDSGKTSTVPRSLFQTSLSQQQQAAQEIPPAQVSYGTNSMMNGLPLVVENAFEQQQQQLYASLPSHQQSTINPPLMYQSEKPVLYQQKPTYYNHSQHSLPPMASSINQHDLNSASAIMPPDSLQSSDIIYRNCVSNSVQASEASAPRSKYQSNLQSNDQFNQYNTFMNNDKLVMMQMQQPNHQQQQQQQQQQNYSSDYHQVPLYSNSEILKNEMLPPQVNSVIPALPSKPPMNQYAHGYQPPNDSFQNNFYANNEEIALQGMQYGYMPLAASQLPAPTDQFTFMHPISHGTPHDEHDEFEYHNVDLERENTDSNWGIRLIGGAEVDRAISIGSMIFGGVASKSGQLKSGDEIISIDGVNVVGATHQHVVELISACTNRVSLVVRRKTFAEACDVVLTKNMDEGFGFVIISNENCALIGKIIEGSPADRCKQLRVRDCIIAVNGRYITPDMKHPEIVNMIKECGSTLRLRVIPVDCYTVKLIKDVQNDSFGFRMRGGSEYDGTPLYIVRVEPNGQAHGLLNVSDQILEINNIPTVGMTHQQAATIIKYSDPTVKLKLRRNYVTPPSLLVDSPRSLQKYNQTAEMKQVNLASTPNNLPSSHDVSFASLPSNVNLMSQQQQQQQQLQQLPTHQLVAMPDQSMHQHQQPLHHQPIYDHHSMTYVDSSSLYAT